VIQGIEDFPVILTGKSKCRILITYRVKKLGQLAIGLVDIPDEIIYLVNDQDSYSNKTQVILIVEVGKHIDKSKGADYDEYNPE
jgi:hypothetical protein